MCGFDLVIGFVVYVAVEVVVVDVVDVVVCSLCVVICMCVYPAASTRCTG